MVPTLMLWTLVLTCGPGGAQQVSPADPVLATVLEAERTREENVPPLTLCGVLRVFYTPLRWRLSQAIAEVVGDPEAGKPPPGREGGAVAVTVWEAPDLSHWEREYQGVYRGWNNWVGPRSEGKPQAVADMNRVERNGPERLLVIDRTIGYPRVTVEPPRPERGWHAFGRYLGLHGFLGLLSAGFADYGGQPGWHAAPVEQEGKLVTVRLAYVGQGERGEEVAEMTCEFDLGPPVVALRQRYVDTVADPPGGHAEQTEWSDFRPLSPDVLLPASATYWRFYYQLPELGSLVQTEVFTWYDLQATDPAASPTAVPRYACWDQADSTEGLFDPSEVGLGGVFLRLSAGFADEKPPDPPADLVSLDPLKAAQEIKARYGLQ